MSRELIFLLLFLPLPLGFALDMLLGDPHWLYHPVRLMGAVIAGAERWLRRRFPATRLGERAAGRVLAAAVPLLFLAGSAALLWGLWRIHPALWFAFETLLCYQLPAAGSLRDESMAVYRRLEAGDLPGARRAVGRIVGRDTDALDASGVARAAVETVAENTSDGVVAPLLYLAVGGGPLGLWYKAVNTLDSMVGYKNDRYLHFGRASARLDDAANYLPARISAGCMLLAVEPAGFSAEHARRIYRRDRRNHASPNSAHTEAVCAGALGIQLGGDAVYFGISHRKPTIGDPTRPVAPEDIPRAGKLMRFASLAALLLGCFLRALVILLLLRACPVSS